MEWPPKFVTYKEFMNQIKEACNTHPDFEQWLISGPYLCLSIPSNTKRLSVEDLKRQYFNEMNTLIYEKIYPCAALDLHIKNLKYTQDDINDEQLYNCREIKYAENMPSKMKYKLYILELFDKTIKDYTETINKITSTN